MQNSPWKAIFAVCFFSVAVVACGGDGGTVGGDQDGADGTVWDIVVSPDAVDGKTPEDKEINVVFPDYGKEAAVPDGSSIDVDLVSDETTGLIECSSGDECETGICVEGADGVKYCAPPCLDQDCPPGWKCAQITDAGDVSFICLPAANYLCRPCENHDDCAPSGLLSGNRCVEFDPSGRFCGQDCSDGGECPDGYTCAELLEQRGDEASYQCVPVTGECECTEEFIAGGFSTVCYLENEFGLCDGSSQCGPEGMTPCTATLPAGEICNGQDDNCDGTTDEGIEPVECEKTYGEFVCTGPEVCEGGELVCKATEPTEEKCDGMDNDCNGTTDEEDAIGCTKYYLDADDDSYGLEGDSKCLCSAVEPYSVQVKGDCDDTNPEANPAAPEKCDGADNDCNGLTDEAGGADCQVLYWDQDLDGYGVADNSKCLCGSEESYTASDTGDCNDADPSVNPGEVESCNGKDDDCDGQVDEEGADSCVSYYFDGDSDAFGVTSDSRCLCSPDGKYSALQGGDCNDSDQDVFPGATEVCNGKDDDCAGGVDEEGALGCQEYYYDGDEDLYGVTTNSHCLCEPDGKYSVLTPGDCNDGDAGINPEAPEICNGADDDCDTQVDEEDADGCATWYRNLDGDDFGDTADVKCLCGPSVPYDVQQGGDCDDSEASVYPGASESCNDKDDDCDGMVDENFPDKDQLCDGPDVDLCEEGMWVCMANGTGVVCSDDSLADAEVCDNQDNDCDGQIDEDFPDKGLNCDGPDGDDCLEGFWECNGTVLVCSDVTGTIIELCNQQDDDCDGQIDEDFPTKGQPCDGSDGDLCQEGAWVCNGTGLTCSDGTGTNSESCNAQDDDCDGSTDESLTQPCSTICGSGTETCIGGGWLNCTAQQPTSCTNFQTCVTEPMCVSSCPSPPAEQCNDKDDDCDGQTDELWWNSDYQGTDFPDTWFGPTLSSCTSGSCQGTTSGRILPEGDEDWLAVHKTESNDWIVDLKGKIWFKGPALSGIWYDVCICWTQNSYCDESSQVCGTSQNGAEVILQTDNGDSWGSDDAAYLDIQVKPNVTSLDWSCTPWSLTWSVWE